MFPERKIVDEVIKEQREKGIPEVQIQKEAATFCSSMANMYHSSLIYEYNNSISNGIKSLKYHGNWGNLIGVSKHALSSAKEVLNKEEYSEIGSMIGDVIACKKKLLDMGRIELLKVLTPEFIKEMSLRKE